MCPAQRIDNRGRDRRVDARPAGHDHGPGGGQAVEVAGSRDLHTVLPPHRAPLQRACLEAIPVRVKFRSEQSEHLSGARELERAQAVVYKGNDQRIELGRGYAACWHDLIE